MSSNKIEFMRFNQDDAISSLSGKSLQLVDPFSYQGSNISSTESDVNIRAGKGEWKYIKFTLFIMEIQTRGIITSGDKASFQLQSYLHNHYFWFCL